MATSTLKKPKANKASKKASKPVAQEEVKQTEPVGKPMGKPGRPAKKLDDHRVGVIDKLYDALDLSKKRVQVSNKIGRHLGYDYYSQLVFKVGPGRIGPSFEITLPSYNGKDDAPISAVMKLRDEKGILIGKEARIHTESATQVVKRILEHYNQVVQDLKVS